MGYVVVGVICFFCGILSGETASLLRNMNQRINEIIERW